MKLREQPLLGRERKAMFKKLLIGGALASALGATVIGTGVWSYARTAGGWIQATAEEAMPLEWEIQRARQMISDLEPEINANAKRIAHERIKVAKLEKQVGETTDKLLAAQRDISRLKEDLESGENVYTYCGKTYTAGQVKEDLSRRFELFKTRKEMADNLEKMLTARQQTLAAANERMEAMLSAKRQLEVEVENLEARLAAIRVAQTSSELALDDSALSRTRELLDRINARIDVEKEMTQVDAEYFGGIELDEGDQADLLDEISAYFGEGSAAGEATELAGIQLDEQTE
jgi:predicted  nucleic acid-binding Zn-ribbon protein